MFQVRWQKPTQSGTAAPPSTANAVAAAVDSSPGFGEAATTQRPSGDTAKISKTR